MALPLPDVQSAADCASFSRTVLPFLPHLQELPTRISEAGKSLDSLKEIYLTTNPLVTAVAFCLSLAALVFILSELTGNYSQVDRLWSILPTVYNGHFVIWAHMVGIQSEILDTIAAISAMWSARLTFNYWRKGGYKPGAEDYRWAIIRSKFNNRFLFTIFNFVFISLAQSILLLLIATPTYAFLLLAQSPEAPTEFSLLDLAYSRFAFCLIIITYFADQQQWDFHRAKHAYQQTARVPDQYKDQFSPEDLDRGFVVSGLWSWCRHPNFVAEQTFWLTLFVWSCYRTQTCVQWTGLGALGYLLIFQGSTRLTEAISASKYPEYRDYQARVRRFIPRWTVEPKKPVVVKTKSKARHVDELDDGEEGSQETGKKSK